MSDKPSDLQTTPQPDTDKDYFNFKAAGLKIDEGYNGSPGHYKNRVNPKWKNYGTCSIVISFEAVNPDYDPSAIMSHKYIKRQLLISYEAFE
jgi:hypothetical protein